MEFNSLLGRGAQLTRGLRAVLGLSEQPGPTTVSPELMVGYDVANPDKFDQLPLGIGTFGLVQIVPAVAAALGFARLRNPAITVGGNNTGTQLVHVTHAIVTENATTRAFTLRYDVTGAAGVGVISRDRRTGSRTSQAVFDVGSEAAGSGANWFRFSALLNGLLILPIDVILSPGDSIAIEDATVNLVFTAGFLWRERAGGPDELDL